jgi:hypothetical protein
MTTSLKLSEEEIIRLLQMFRFDSGNRASVRGGRKLPLKRLAEIAGVRHLGGPDFRQNAGCVIARADYVATKCINLSGVGLRQFCFAPNNGSRSQRRKLRFGPKTDLEHVPPELTR